MREKIILTWKKTMKEGFAVIFFLLVAVMKAQGASISGNVVDLISNEPLPGVTISAFNTNFDSTSRDTISVFTDDNGDYIIDTPSPGVYFLWAKHPGSHTDSYMEMIELGEQDVTGIDFTLISDAIDNSTLSGKVSVLDPLGSWYGTVLAYSEKGQLLGKGRLENQDVSLNNPSEFVEYSIDSLPAESCYVMTQMWGYLPQFYNHAYTSEDAAQAFTSAQNIDFDLEWGGSDTFSTGGAISGTIRGQYGPLVYCAVYAQTQRDNQLVSGYVTGAFGTYSLEGLDPGIYNVYASRPGYQTGEYAWSVTVAYEEVSGIDITLVKDAIEEDTVPFSAYSLIIHPNPFRSSTTVSFSMPYDTRITAGVYDVTGSLVRGLLEGFQPAGAGRLIWDGRDDRGKALSSGVYFLRLYYNGGSTVRSVILLR